MRPSHRFLAAVTVFIAVWSALYSGSFDAQLQKLFPGPLSRVHGVVAAAPAYALIALGCYGLVSVGWALFSFRDCPEKFEALKLDIAQAKDYLAKKGYRQPAQ